MPHALVSEHRRVLEAGRLLGREPDPARILERVVELAAEVTESQYAALAVYDTDGRICRFLQQEAAAAAEARIGGPPRGTSLLSAAQLAGAPVRVDDLREDPQFGGVPAGHPDLRSFLGVPIPGALRRHGDLYVGREEPGSYGTEHEQLLETLAAFAGAALDGAGLRDRERRAARVAAETDGTRARERLRRQLLAQVIDAQEAERARVARDLHDEIGQALTSVLLALHLVDGAVSTAAPDPADARRHTGEARELVADALAQVRRLAFELRPAVLDDLGLAAALRRLTGEVTARHRVRVELSLTGLPDGPRLPAAVETTVYRIVQEALTNVVRHAEASRAEVAVTAGMDGLRVRVADDGRGFRPEQAGEASLGLRGMAERAALTRGTLRVESAPGAGTTVCAEVPVD